MSVSIDTIAGTVSFESAKKVRDELWKPHFSKLEKEELLDSYGIAQLRNMGNFIDMGNIGAAENPNSYCIFVIYRKHILKEQMINLGDKINGVRIFYMIGSEVVY